MAGKIRWLKLSISLAILLSLAVVFLPSPSLATGVISRLDERGSISANHNLTSVPERVVSDAKRISISLFADNKETADDFAAQLVSTYIAARDYKVVVIFNSGGWGWRFVSDSPNWRSIFHGMKKSLGANGIETLFLEYRRSNGTLQSYVDEYVAVVGLDSFKARLLAARVSFLTDQLPEIKVILTGESNGTVICDEVMKILRDNPQVFSVQTGTPFWHASETNGRTLIINDNGNLSDTFASGDFFTIISRNVEALLGFSKFDTSQGYILNLFAAPGHTYTWEDPTVRNQIEVFLDRNVISPKQ